MNLIWVPNQQFALYFLGFCRQYSSLGDFAIVVQDEVVIPEMWELAEEMNVQFVSREYALTQSFEYFLLFSWGLLAYQEGVRTSIKYKKLLLFGDGFNNTLYLHTSARNWDVYGLVFFGYELVDEAFTTSDLPNVAVKYLIDIDHISACVKELQERRKIGDYKHIINDECFLVVDRYWGMDSYRIKDWRKYNEYIKSVLAYVGEYKRVVFKKIDPVFSNEWNEDRQSAIVEFSGTKYLDWETIVTTDSGFRYLTSPEALFLGDRIEPFALFAFDGSTSLIGKWMRRELRVVWPDEIDLDNLFYDPNHAELLREKAILYREVIQLSSLDESTPSSAIRTSGRRMREFIGRFILKHFEARLKLLTQERDALTQERDALTQERDALTQERDALTQERDALTQERDAIVASTIWRATKNIRGLISWLIKYR